MEKLKCKCCGSDAMVKKDIEILAIIGEDCELKAYECKVCGDDWISNKSTTDFGTVISFVHHPDLKPELQRTYLMTDNPEIPESNKWVHYIDEDIVSEEYWFATLHSRRRVLKATALN